MCVCYAGSEYLSEYGNITQRLNPPLKNVPFIVFKEQIKEGDSDLAQENFIKAICQYIDTNKPPECKSSASRMSLAVVAFVLIFVKQFF